MLTRAWKALTGPAVPDPESDTPLPVASSMQTVDLLDADWRLESQDGNHCVRHAALPAQALQILHRAGLVGNPLARCEPSPSPSQHISLRDTLGHTWCSSGFCASHVHNWHTWIVHLRWSTPCRFNDEELKWVAEEVWVFSRRFDLQPEALARASIELLLTG